MSAPLRAWTVFYVEYTNQEKQKIVLARSAAHALKVFTEQRQHSAERLNKTYLATNYTLLRAQEVGADGKR